ncbi:MAG: DUF1835 domain-containing protein [Blastocatellia bacterium]
MLHIHNGDSTANTMKESGFRGEHFPFREALAVGPTPQGLSQDEWTSARARFLSEAGDLEIDNVKRDLSAQDEKLARAAISDEVIMWFEHDLFCQINMIYLLNRFALQNMDKTRLSLICIGEFAGRENFRGLGELSAEQMASLFDTRHEMTDPEMSLAEKAWAAFCRPDPRAIEDQLAEDTSALPYLRNALIQHLARFPSVNNGLGRAENRLLEIVSEGIHDFLPLCKAFFDREPDYGLGDSQVWRDIKRMSAVAEPLVTITGFDDSASFYSRIHKTSFDITKTGADVLNGNADFVDMNPSDLWLGGVHLSGENLWRWDEQRQRLIAG